MAIDVTPENAFLGGNRENKKSRVIKSTRSQVEKTFNGVNPKNGINYSKRRRNRNSQKVIKANPSRENESNSQGPSKEAKALAEKMRKEGYINNKKNTLNNYRSDGKDGYIQKEEMSIEDKEAIKKIQTGHDKRVYSEEQNGIGINMKKNTNKGHFRKYFLSDGLIHILDDIGEKVVAEYIKNYRRLTIFIKKCLEDRDRDSIVKNYSSKLDLSFLQKFKKKQ